MTTAPAISKLVALVATFAVALALGACGDSDDDGSGSQASASQTEATTSTDGSGSPEEQVEAAFDQIQTDFRAGRYETVCDSLTARGVQQTTVAGGSEYPTCVAFVREAGRLLRQSASSEFRPSVIKVRVNGDNAVATIKLGDVKTRNYVFAKEDGAWKLDQALQ